MIEILSFVVIGILLLVVSVLVVRRTEPKTSESFGTGIDRAEPNSLVFDNSGEFLDRIFGNEDWNYVRQDTSARVQRLFKMERKRIALYWLSQLRDRTKAAMHLHLMQVRNFEKLDVALELKLMVGYWALRLRCEVLIAMISLGGPAGVRRMLGYASDLGSRSQNLEVLVSRQARLDGKQVLG